MNDKPSRDERRKAREKKRSPNPSPRHRGLDNGCIFCG